MIVRELSAFHPSDVDCWIATERQWELIEQDYPAWNRRQGSTGGDTPSQRTSPLPARQEEALREALEPFAKAFDVARNQHMKRSAEAVALGHIWFDEMPGNWPINLTFTMGDFRKVRAALSASPSRTAMEEAAQLARDQTSDDPAPGDWNDACEHIARKLAALSSKSAPAAGKGGE